MDRYGIATAGNWIVDRVKIVDHYPEEETLASISAEERGTGGGAYNCIVDLHQLGASFPLTALGCVGNDADGEWIRADLEARGIDHRGIVTGAAPTSYTDVMSVAATGRRTFFHCTGANAEFGPEHIPYDSLSARVVHLAYLLLLARLDRPDAEFGSVGARVLAELSSTGAITCLDVVSEDSPRVQGIVVPALAQVDCLIINELEAGTISGETTRVKKLTAGADSHHPQPQVISVLSGQGVKAAARRLLELGVRRWVVIHMPEGGYALGRDGQEFFQPSLELPQDFIAGAAGAGDAFASGILYGLHEDWEISRSLRLAVATAAASLRHPTTTAGVGPLEETLDLLDRYPTRQWVQDPFA
ncbi:MAG: carbohydrate kinase family protein [Armatimonadetes bacterium]|nr:carbohydrate kinase family protein [Armatimonadota bacterium]